MGETVFAQGCANEHTVIFFFRIAVVAPFYLEILLNGEQRFVKRLAMELTDLFVNMTVTETDKSERL